jgi:hypothetical protein
MDRHALTQGMDAASKQPRATRRSAFCLATGLCKPRHNSVGQATSALPAALEARGWGGTKTGTLVHLLLLLLLLLLILRLAASGPLL